MRSMTLTPSAFSRLRCWVGEGRGRRSPRRRRPTAPAAANSSTLPCPMRVAASGAGRDCDTRSSVTAPALWRQFGELVEGFLEGRAASGRALAARSNPPPPGWPARARLARAVLYASGPSGGAAAPGAAAPAPACAAAGGLPA